MINLIETTMYTCIRFDDEHQHLVDKQIELISTIPNLLSGKRHNVIVGYNEVDGQMEAQIYFSGYLTVDEQMETISKFEGFSKFALQHFRIESIIEKEYHHLWVPVDDEHNLGAIQFLSLLKNEFETGIDNLEESSVEKGILDGIKDVYEQFNLLINKKPLKKYFSCPDIFEFYESNIDSSH